MKKKLLLCLILCLFGVLNFSNAQDSTCYECYLGNACYPPYLEDERMTCEDSCEEDEECRGQCETDFWNAVNNSFLNSDDEDYLACMSEYCSLECSSTGGGDDSGNDDILGGVILSGGFSELSPVISGVKDTTSQLIPLVIYIGIGILISTLGFYAIRWLMVWLWRKLTSLFSSKRG